MVKTLSLTTVLLAALPAFAQRKLEDPPIVGRPADFSNVVGKYTIHASAEPLEVFVEEPMTLTIRITGSGPQKYEPERKHLQIFPNWEDDFHVESVPDEDRVLKAGKTWIFVYRLRPKHTKVSEIDDIRLSYYDPMARDFKKSYAAAIEGIRVKPKPPTADKIAAAIVLPGSFYRLEETENLLTRSQASMAPGSTGIALALAIPPIACVIGFFAWRRLFPDEGSRLAKRRSQAASEALVQLKYAGGRPWKVVEHYLQERFDFSIDDATPADVAEFLQRRGFAKPHCALAKVFFQSCDAARYVPAPRHVTELHVEAARLIQELESDPCLR